MLGLKFCITKSPNFNLVKKCVQEAIRKISWKVFFLTNPTGKQDSNFLIKCKKDFRNISNKKLKNCPITNEIFDTKLLEKNFFNFCSKFKFEDGKIFNELIADFQFFCSQNNIMIIEADKNAGICIVNKTDYDNEVLRQLSDISTYYPSTSTAFKLAMLEFNDKANIFYKKLPESYNLKPLKFTVEEPAKFYILPKVHKSFDTFPKGRPISSTFRKSNKYVSKLLDNVLRPCMYEISDLLIDTQHFLLLLDNVNLDPTKTYHLITVDVEALYPSLQINDCKKHCSESYLRNVHNSTLPFSLNKREILDLIGLSLDYNFVAYDNQMFYQHKGIEMGNSASVSVANITVFHEISTIFKREEIVFYKRFLDDIFLILDSTDIMNVNDWINNVIKHRYLKFTFESSSSGVNFLDVNVKLGNGNVINTELFSKPMSKHVYLHSNSDHPSHLKNSLFYSQGLRVIRLCSRFSTRLTHIISIYKKFVDRGYDQSILHNTFLTLIMKDRFSTLKPKKDFLIRYLHEQNRNILEKYNITSNICTTSNFSEKNPNVYVIFPFYKCINKYKVKIMECIKSNIQNNCTDDLKVVLESIVINVVFSRTKNVKELLKF